MKNGVFDKSTFTIFSFVEFTRCRISIYFLSTSKMTIKSMSHHRLTYERELGLNKEQKKKEKIYRFLTVGGIPTKGRKGD